MSIGKGVLGSGHETQSRSKVEWTQGNAYFLHANGGKALGWLHTQTDPRCQTLGHTIIYNIKISLKGEKIRSPGGDGDDGVREEKWVEEMLHMFDDAVKTFGQAAQHDVEKKPADSTLPYDPSGFAMSAEKSAAIANIIAALES